MAESTLNCGTIEPPIYYVTGHPLDKAKSLLRIGTYANSRF